MVGVILAAGNGTRFGNAQYSKVLNRINNTTLIELEVEEAYIVVGNHSEMIVAALGNEYNGIRIQYAYQAKQIGLINALVQAIALVPEGETVCLQLADEVFIGLKSETIKCAISEMRSDFYCGITIDEDPGKIKQNYSVEICGESRITRCVEKPEVVVNDIKGTGLCFFGYDILQMLSRVYDLKTGTPRDLCDFVNYLIAEGKTVTALCVAEKEFNINTPADLEEAAAFVRQHSAS